jgi:acetyl-CoA C-acetyltransferase
VYAVYSSSPGVVRPPDTAAVKAALKSVPDRTVLDAFEGTGTIAAYSVAHGRDGNAERGVLIVDTPDHDRAYAVVRDDDLVAALEESELVGTEVVMAAEGAQSLATW